MLYPLNITSAYFRLRHLSTGITNGDGVLSETYLNITGSCLFKKKVDILWYCLDLLFLWFLVCMGEAGLGVIPLYGYFCTKESIVPCCWPCLSTFLPRLQAIGTSWHYTGIQDIPLQFSENVSVHHSPSTFIHAFAPVCIQRRNYTSSRQFSDILFYLLNFFPFQPDV